MTPAALALPFPLRLREAGPEDTAFLRRVYADSRASELARTNWSESQKAAFCDSQFDAQDRHYRQHYANARFDVLEHAGVPVGRVYLHETPSELRLMDIALLGEHRGRGFGRSVMNALLSEARAGRKLVTLHVEADNFARAWYERLGFVEVEERGPYLFMRWAPPEDTAAT